MHSVLILFVSLISSLKQNEILESALLRDGPFNFQGVVVYVFLSYNLMLNSGEKKSRFVRQKK